MADRSTPDADADFPPGIDAPSPEADRARIAAGLPAAPPDVSAEIRRLAARVGGLRRLRELVAEMERTGC